jgi:integrase
MQDRNVLRRMVRYLEVGLAMNWLRAAGFVKVSYVSPLRLDLVSEIRRYALNDDGEDVKTVQELLRHANSRIMLEVYPQAATSHKRAAQSKIVKMMVPNLGEMRREKHPHSTR